MQYSKLGSSAIDVSRICLGSMTWGLQNNQQDAAQQIDYALAQGINFIDTAEMYAVPPSAETYGKTETIIGHYIAKNPSKRQDFILASKIAGPGLDWVRDGGLITGDAVESAVDASLKRLQTDYIDLFQLHWPNRQSPHFGKHAPNSFKFSDADSAQQTAQMLDILQGLDKCVKAGKIRFCGLSDDTPWGINTYLKLSEKYDLPRMVSIQNEFNLLHSKDWPYLIENCVQEDIAYLPWSPLASGMLSGKYLNGARPQGSRWTFSQRNRLFRDTPVSELAIKAYQEIAVANGISTAQLALKWCDQVDGVTSTIIGATSMTQLVEDIDAFKAPLSAQALTDIANILKQYPAPF
ncbi:aldo/keto reductase [Psychromonas antarctica]|jgi:aryl-alcohol dehydrogenase-like predicted oxidoreductase|uniref:aldo/keto reductase n=1 Tax=Psychromonas antarctica TaxID=67573 RepID=UPI001EE8656E|nr:aldo/keto reductase [Psychromonas antarctica]MCG6200250.1 aldo/keto reductase [Psychromonas antarctica]